MTDLDTWEQELRHESGFRAPLKAAQNGPGRSMAVLRQAAPVHEREPPAGFSINDPLAEHPLPRGTAISGPITSRDQAGQHIKDGVGWLVCVNGDGSKEPVPVVAGRYYDGHPELAIIAEMTVPAPESPLAEAISGGGSA